MREDIPQMTWEMKEDAMQTYQALLGRADNVAKALCMRLSVEEIGGKVEMAAPTSTGMVRVTLWLPPHYQPADFFPDLPFYPF